MIDWRMGIIGLAAWLIMLLGARVGSWVIAALEWVGVL